MHGVHRVLDELTLQESQIRIFLCLFPSVYSVPVSWSRRMNMQPCFPVSVFPQSKKSALQNRHITYRREQRIHQNFKVLHGSRVLLQAAFQDAMASLGSLACSQPLFSPREELLGGDLRGPGASPCHAVPLEAQGVSTTAQGKLHRPLLLVAVWHFG